MQSATLEVGGSRALGRRWIAILLASTACTSMSDAGPGTGEQLGGHSEAIVYGDDNREDYYAVDESALQEIVRDSLVALIPTNRLHRPSSGSVRIVSQNLKDAYGLC